MRVLLACAGGMSSSFVAEAIENVAKAKGITTIEVKAVGDMRVKEELGLSEWDVIMLAPQIKFQADKIKALVGDKNIPVYLINGLDYTAMGAEKIFADLEALVK